MKKRAWWYGLLGCFNLGELLMEWSASGFMLMWLGMWIAYAVLGASGTFALVQKQLIMTWFKFQFKWIIESCKNYAIQEFRKHHFNHQDCSMVSVGLKRYHIHTYFGMLYYFPSNFGLHLYCIFMRYLFICLCFQKKKNVGFIKWQVSWCL